MKLIVERIGHRIGDEERYEITVPKDLDAVVTEAVALLRALRALVEKK